MIGSSIVRVIPGKIEKMGSVCGETEPQVDRALARIDHTRSQAILNLINNPEEFILTIWGSLLSKDRSCKFRMGGSNPTLKERLEGKVHHLTSNRYFKCDGCRLLESIIPPKKSVDGGCFSPEYGKSKGLKYSVLKVEDVISKISRTNQQGQIINQIISRNQLARACQPHLSILAKAKYYSLDPFTNRLLISWYLEKVLDKSKMPHLRKMYYGFICGNDGYFLREENNYLKFSELGQIDRKTVFNILYQLFGLFHRLRNYDLSFHTIDQNTIIIENSPSRYEYDDVIISSEITLKINDLSEAGITVSALDDPNQIIRIYRSSTQPEKRFENKSFKSINWNRHYELSSSPGTIPESWVSYKISEEGLEREQRTAFLYANRMGLPLYQSSFDIYRLILLLTSNPEFYEIMVFDPQLSKIWASFWIPSEYHRVQERIRSHQACLYHKTESLDACPLATILTRLTLRCDIVGHVWSLLKEVYNS